MRVWLGLVPSPASDSGLQDALAGGGVHVPLGCDGGICHHPPVFVLALIQHSKFCLYLNIRIICGRCPCANPFDV